MNYRRFAGSRSKHPRTINIVMSSWHAPTLHEALVPIVTPYWTRHHRKKSFQCCRSRTPTGCSIYIYNIEIFKEIICTIIYTSISGPLDLDQIVTLTLDSRIWRQSSHKTRTHINVTHEKCAKLQNLYHHAEL